MINFDDNKLVIDGTTKKYKIKYDINHNISNNSNHKSIELECPNCGGHPDIKNIDLEKGVYVCPFCNSVHTLPKSNINPENIVNNITINIDDQKINNRVNSDKKSYHMMGKIIGITIGLLILGPLIIGLIGFVIVLSFYG